MGDRPTALAGRDALAMATFATILIIALVGGLVVWLLVRRPHPDSPQLRTTSETPTMHAPTAADLGIHVEVRSGPRPGEPDPWGDEDRHADYPLHAVGESHYQDALREIGEAAEDPGPNWLYRGAQCASKNAPPEAPARISSIDGADGRTRYSVDLSLDGSMREDPQK